MIQSIEVCPWFSVVKKDQRNSLPFHPSLMSFCRKGLPGVTESTAAIFGEQPSPWGEDALKDRWGMGKVLFPCPLPPSAAVPPLPEGEGYFFGWWILRLRLRLCAEWQGKRHAVKSGSFGLENPTERRSVSMWIDLLMMLCVLVLDCCHVHRFWIDSCLWQRT